MTSNAIVQKLWNYCNILRDDGLSYQDYIEQLMVLTNLPFGKKSSISVVGEDGDEQRETLTIVRDDEQQAAQLCAARALDFEDRWPRCGGGAG